MEWTGCDKQWSPRVPQQSRACCLKSCGHEFNQATVSLAPELHKSSSPRFRSRGDADVSRRSNVSFGRPGRDWRGN